MRPLLLILGLATAPGCIWHRIGDLNMVSTRNVDMDNDYVLLEAYQKATVNAQRDGLEAAVDKVVKQVPGGEFTMNTKIYVKANGNRIKIEADVWGLRDSAATAAQTTFAVGDWVTWQAGPGQFPRGRIVGVGPEGAVIEVTDGEKGGLLGTVGSVVGGDGDRTVRKPFDKLTAIEAP